jgi:hypothetical protein
MRVGLDAVLAARRRIAAASGQLEDLVPLGAVLAELERFAEADAVYRRALVRRRFTVPTGVVVLSARHPAARGRRRGASTPEGDVRVFAGLRSDPFYLAWIAA